MTEQDRQHLSAQIGQTAEQAARIATASLWRSQIAKFRRVALIAGFFLIVGAAYYLGSARSSSGRTPRPQDRATAKCWDDTWSYAASRQGACAGHGGVKVFYK